jgi:hypothetical protein
VAEARRAREGAEEPPKAQPEPEKPEKK